ncbi:hypothetical protein HK405_007000, partial [Cladochytrium tenue]
GSIVSAGNVGKIASHWRAMAKSGVPSSVKDVTKLAKSTAQRSSRRKMFMDQVKSGLKEQLVPELKNQARQMVMDKAQGALYNAIYGSGGNAAAGGGGYYQDGSGGYQDTSGGYQDTSGGYYQDANGGYYQDANGGYY